MEEITKRQGTPTDHLANERTLLAWVRTSIAVMAFGFVVVKFSLFLRQLTILLGKNESLPQSHGHSSLIGVLLVTAGAFILPASYLRFRQTTRQISNSNFKSSPTSFLILIVFLLLVSVLLILYLVENTGS